MAAAFCWYCGAPLSSGSQYCARCGQRVVPAPASAAPSQSLRSPTTALPYSPARSNPPQVYSTRNPPKKRDTGLIIGVALIVAIVVIEVGVLAYQEWGALSGKGDPGEVIVIAGATSGVQYSGSTSGYLADAVRCPGAVLGGASFNCTLQLTSNASGEPHSVHGVDVLFPFVLEDVAPLLPVNISSGQSLSLTVWLLAPDFAGSYVVSLTVQAV